MEIQLLGKNGKGFKQLVPSLKAVAHKMNIKKTFYSKLGDLKSKVLEMFDMYKDYGYLFFFNHKVGNLIVLVYSIMAPIAGYHSTMLGETTYSIKHTLLVHLHLSNSKLENIRRGGGVLIALGESFPQLIIQVLELLDFRNSINFW